MNPVNSWLNQKKKEKTDKKFTRSPQRESYAWLSLSIFTISFFLIVAIRPTVITITKLIREVKEKETASLLLDKKIDSLVTAQKVYAKNSQYFPMVEQALPENSEFPLLADFLSNAAQSSQIELSTLAFEKIILKAAPSAKKPGEPAAYQTINFSTTAEGDYLNLKNFVSLLENSRRLIQVESTSVSEIKKKNKEENEEEIKTALRLTISGIVFFENE